MIISSTHARGGVPTYIAIAALFVFVLGLFRQHYAHAPTGTDASDSFDAEEYHSSENPESQHSLAHDHDDEDDPTGKRLPLYVPGQAGLKTNLKSFYEIARLAGTDKVTEHNYQDMYARYLPYLRTKTVKMLEIGLGCDMAQGPGTSWRLWTEYFRHLDLHVVEANATCASKFNETFKGAQIIAGDPSDKEFLDQVIKSHGMSYDLIIDNGNHHMDQQKLLLQQLWKAVRPGGIYFTEKLHTSYKDEYGGGATAIANGGTMMQYVYKLMDDMMKPTREIIFDEVESMYHIDCSQRICAFFKRPSTE